MSRPKSEPPRLPKFLCQRRTAKEYMHYYQFNIGDYASHTGHLDPIEDIAYRRMLDWCYIHETKLPLDVESISRLIRMRDYSSEIRDVLNEFFEKTDEGWFSSRVQREIEHYRTKVEQASRAGKASAERRLNGRSTDVQPTNNQEPITNNQEPLEVAKATRPRQAGTPSAPVDEIVDMYNKQLPMLSAVTVINDSRRRAISARWREVVTADKLDREKGIEFFQWFFHMVSKSKFLTGKVKDWKADIDFLFNASKFPRIIEGAYHKE